VNVVTAFVEQKQAAGGMWRSRQPAGKQTNRKESILFRGFTSMRNHVSRSFMHSAALFEGKGWSKTQPTTHL
jgi:hypothetical protein